ncbi:MAG: ECF-type sigma factor [Pirellulaceae bacterium]
MSDVTRILIQIESGDPSAAEHLLPLVYEELRKLAAARLAQEKPGQSFQATALVHDAYLRLVDTDKPLHWNSRGHFFGAAAEAMRRILVEQARHKARIKHGGGLQRVELSDPPLNDDTDRELLALDLALPRLAAEDRMAAEVVKLKYFAGLGREEISSILGCSVHEIRQKWAYARAWLRLELEK